MKKLHYKLIAAAVLTSVMLSSLTGCLRAGDDSYIPVTNSSVSSKTPDTPKQSNTDTDSDTESTAPAKAKSVKCDVDNVTLEVGQTKTVKAEIKPTDEQAVWSSSDESIAAVDKDGKITAVKAGKCVIKAAAKSNDKVSDEIEVTVKEKPAQSKTESKAASSSAAPKTTSSAAPSSTTTSSEEKAQKVTDISLFFPDNNSLILGHTAQPTVILTPANVDNNNVTLTTSDTSVISINSDGSITANQLGSATITAVSESNKNAKTSVTVTVTEPPRIEPVLPPETDSNTYDDTQSEEDNSGSEQPREVSDDYPRSMCYIDGVLIVNKTYSVPASYNPGGLTQETLDAFYRLQQGAAQDGVNIWVVSGFRSYETQNSLYWSYVSWNGQAAADTFSARPGHSEHQTGMAIDCNSVYDSFAGTREAVWLENHCHEYGFIIRYPYGKQHITGYKYEPWHIRYVGDIAEDIYNSGLTLEEYFGISSVYE